MRRVFKACMGVGMALLAGRMPAGDAALPPHPRLLLDRADIEALKGRVAQAPWPAVWSAYTNTVNESLARPVELPPRGGNWSHNYVCPEHGTRLQRGRALAPWQWEHRCPVGPHILLGDPARAHLDFDGVAIGAMHDRFARLLADAGVVYQVTGERRYADKAREILLAYADRYLGYAVHDNAGRPRVGGRVASQPLSESMWLIDMAQGADLVWDTLSDEQRRAVETKLFRPALDQVILPNKLGIHNIQCWNNSAIGLVGYLLGDAALIHAAVDDPGRGFRSQIRRGVRDDGMWCEGASGYHVFALRGLWPLAEAARHCGLDLYDARFKSMFDGPLAQVMPNFTLPNVNDSEAVPLVRRAADLYELAYARWHDPRYLPVMSGARQDNLALWYGVPVLPPAGTSPELRSHNSPASGYAVLTRGAGEAATWVQVKYGPHGGGHGHYDKNGMILYARGRVVMPDAGMHLYGSPLHGTWDKTTVAHNTLVVDEASQAEAEGRCLAFGSTRGVDFAMTDAGDIHAGVRFVRTVALLDETLAVIVDRVQADTPHVFDLACHVTGAWHTLPEGRPWAPPPVAGYSHIGGATSRLSATGLAVAADATLTIAGGVPTEYITGTGVGASTADPVPILLMRRQAKATTFVWAVSPEARPVALEATPAGDAGTAVQVRSGDRHWTLTVDPEAGRDRFMAEAL